MAVGSNSAEIAEKLFISDKTVSKWENGKGYPDISLLESIAKVFDVSVTELMSGKTVSNINQSGNMMRSKFYICPVCGNVELNHTSDRCPICGIPGASFKVVE